MNENATCSENTIYIIDDNLEFANSLSDYFTDSGFTVTVIQDEFKGIELIERNPPSVVFLDLGLKKLNGIEILKQIKKTNEFLPVIIISGTEILDEAVEAIKQGADDFISKPIRDLNAVELCLQRACEKNRLKSELNEYKINLEELIERRTKELNDKKRELENTNQALVDEIDKRKKAEEYIKQGSLNIINAVEDERKRLSLDLHDSVIQKLTYAKMSLELFERFGSDGNNHFGKALKSIDQIAEEIRMIIRYLYPQSIDKYSLTQNLATLVRQFEDFSNAVYTIDIAGQDNIKNPKIKLNVYRVFQEVFNNITKHAGAKRVSIIINLTANVMTAEIRDDGKGFDTEVILKSKKGTGFFSMNERIAQLGGNIKFDSLPEGGSIVSFQIPLEEQ